jgi:hypothetical protein
MLRHETQAEHEGSNLGFDAFFSMLVALEERQAVQLL